MTLAYMRLIMYLKSQCSTFERWLLENSFITNPKLRSVGLRALLPIALVFVMFFLQAVWLKILCALSIVYVQIFLVLQTFTFNV